MPLNDVAIKNAKIQDTQYRVADGKGLCLLVKPSGAKYWRFRYRFAGKKKRFLLEYTLKFH